MTRPLETSPSPAVTGPLCTARWGFVFTFTALCLVIAGGGCRRKLSPADAGPDGALDQPRTERIPEPPLAPPCQRAPGSFAEIANRLAPNLVTLLGPPGESSGPRSALPLFRTAAPAAAWTRDPSRPETPLESLGTGFLLDAEGMLVTSYHSVGEVPQVTARLHDGSLVQATLRGTAPDLDLALFTLEQPAPDAVALVDSARLRPGDWLALLADPFGAGVMVTAGVVRFQPNADSALLPGAIVPFLGADITIDAANQGGLVTDAGGRLVGLAVSSAAAGSRIGLVLPVSELRRQISLLGEPGQSPRSWIGLWVRPLGAEDARDLELEPPRGLLVTRIVPAGPAHEAGIQPRDVILEFAGEPTSTPAAFAALASRAEVSQSIPVVVWRDGRQRTLRLRPAPMPQ